MLSKELMVLEPPIPHQKTFHITKMYHCNILQNDFATILTHRIIPGRCSVGAEHYKIKTIETQELYTYLVP